MTIPRSEQPLILTLSLDPASQTEFETQRRRFYPATLNQIPAHVSLFHALPSAELPAIHDRLTQIAAATPAFPVEVQDVKKLGRGVAYALHADELSHMHAQLRQPWLPWLTGQDAQGFRPHIVIQNKVDPPQARALYERLAGGFRPWSATATGLLLWRYLGGPWALEADFPFLPTP